MTTAGSLDQLCINTIRTLSIDAVQKANSGHPGLPMGAAPMAFVLWHRHLKHYPAQPDWPDRDRFVLSAGHGCMLLYSLLHLAGYELSLDDIKQFRQWESKTPGHPESFMTSGVEAVTGPLGQGAANIVGMAMAERSLAHRFNRSGHSVIDHYSYALMSDGDVMEGVACEAAALAGHLKLGKLICLYDANDVTLDGPASLSFSEDIGKRYESVGWQVLRVEDGDHDLEAIDRAIEHAKADTGRPSLIEVRTTIGYGSPNKHGKASSHGSPLGDDEVRLTKQTLGWDSETPFHIPSEVSAHFRRAFERGVEGFEDWTHRFEAYQKEHPSSSHEWDRCWARRLPEDWEEAIPRFDPGDRLATRVASGKVLNAVAETLPELIGGDADLSGSTKTAIKSGESFEGQQGSGRNIHFGVREHAMGSVVNGMLYHGGLRAYSATFFCFADYMRPAVRLAALAGLPQIFVWTHDSIGLGEDGPTHQPVEHLMGLRVIPNLHVIRPCDANETAQAWAAALERVDGPTALVLTRQNLETLDRAELGAARELRRGGYVLQREKTQAPPTVLFIASGSEVAIALETSALLQAEDIACRVVSMPCWEAFAAQSEDYRQEVLAKAATPLRVSIEAGTTLGWERHIGDKGLAIGLDRFGASAPGETNFERFGFSASRIADRVRTRLQAG